MKTDSIPSPVAGSPAVAPVVGQVPGQPVYGQANYDSGVRYATDDPVLPVDDGGVVRLGTAGLPDAVFLNLVQSENEAMTANPNYTTPNPTVAVLGAALTDLQQKLNAVTLGKTALKEATNVKDVSRATVETLYKTRGSYVQLTSNGNTALILNAGFSVRATPTPVGILPPPYNLMIELNGTPGVMLLGWTGVLYARSYIIQCSPADTMAREWSPLKTSSVAKLRLDGLTLGQVYAFRIAAVGGSTGQSDWSAEVVRMAA